MDRDQLFSFVDNVWSKRLSVYIIIDEDREKAFTNIFEDRDKVILNLILLINFLSLQNDTKNM